MKSKNKLIQALKKLLAGNYSKTSKEYERQKNMIDRMYKKHQLTQKAIFDNPPIYKN